MYRTRTGRSHIHFVKLAPFVRSQGSTADVTLLFTNPELFPILLSLKTVNSITELFLRLQERI